MSSLDGEAVDSLASVTEAKLVEVKPAIATVKDEAVEDRSTDISGTYGVEAVMISRETAGAWLTREETVDSRSAGAEKVAVEFPAVLT